jgi:NADP-dependent aldehyde dehydrogenase
VATFVGLSFVAGARAPAGARTFVATDPATGRSLPTEFHAATPADVDAAVRAASEAFPRYAATLPTARATFMREIAAALEAADDAIVARAERETALPEARLRAEIRRTADQLRLFATLVCEGAWVDARIDLGDPARKPVPKPDVRSMRVPIGPVVVFGASNFPLAFSVAGGDTASALAAGNPVIVKAHPAHPGTSEIVAAIVCDTARRCDLPPGTFSLLFDDGHDVGRALVRHPRVRAAAFTGSRAGGEALLKIAAARPEPIPVFAEMSSVNPVFVLAGALAERGESLAAGLHASFTLSVGQMCTKPGVVLVPDGAAGDAFVERLADATRRAPAGVMLTARIAGAYEEGLRAWHERGATRIASGSGAALFATRVSTVIADRALLTEVFGPCALVVRYDRGEELIDFAQALEGQLTATIHASAGDLARCAPLVSRLAAKVGRLVFGGFPTGVEVGDAMVHGGPYPATSDGRTTSVGTRAIERFTRLVAYQDCPSALLPEELRDANPRGVTRLVNGAASWGALATGDGVHR